MAWWHRCTLRYKFDLHNVPISGNKQTSLLPDMGTLTQKSVNCRMELWQKTSYSVMKSFVCSSCKRATSRSLRPSQTPSLSQRTATTCLLLTHFLNTFETGASAMHEKSLLTKLAETLDQHRAERKVAHLPASSPTVHQR